MLSSVNIKFCHSANCLDAWTMMTILVTEHEEKRRFGRCRCKLEGKNKMDCTTLGKDGMDWLNMAKDRDSSEHK
jgi:hypothetical protein